MRAAILCPGPTLQHSWPWPAMAFDVRIAVNRAILHEPASEWWAAADWPMLQSTLAKPSVGICTQDDPARMLRGGSLIPVVRMPPQILAWSDLPNKYPGYSTLSAFGLAEHLGATEIYLFGDDKMGTRDFDGAMAGLNRGADRWTKEWDLQKKTTTRLITAGIRVFEVRPSPFCPAFIARPVEA